MAKILVVDDDRHLANLTKVTLLKKGYDVAVVNDSADVINEVRKQKPDLILMDIMMPKLSGAETVKNLRKHPDLNNIPVIFLTALVDCKEDIGVQGIKIDGTYYKTFGKPYEIENLYKIVEGALSKVGGEKV